MVKEMIEYCFKVLPPPHDCVYSIITLGSLAREEATPFSDFEWAILIGKNNETHKNYFRRLSELLWVKVLNLGETTARMMDIAELDWLSESDDPCRKGFSFDGQMYSGCHTPLGNIHHLISKIKVIQQSIMLSDEEKITQIKNVKDEQYELIGTPEELAQYQTHRWGAKRGFCTVLSTVDAIISNNDDLLRDYNGRMADVWNAKLESNPNQTFLQQRSLKYLTESLERFQFQGGYFSKEAHFFDAKYHLYRLPNMLIDHVASYFGVQSKSLWSRIDSIFGQNGVVNLPEKSKTLKELVSQVLGLRLRAYLNAGFRNDHIVMFNADRPEKNIEVLKKYFGVDEPLLLQIYSELIEFQWRIKAFGEQQGALVALEKQYDHVTDFARGEVYRLLLNYPKAITSYEDALQSRLAAYGSHHLAVADTLNNLGNVFELQARYQDAIAAFQQAMQILATIYNDSDHVSVADILNNLGNVYKAKAQYAESIIAYEKAAKIWRKAFGPNHHNLAVALNNLGTVHAEQSQYSKAMALFEEAKKIKIVIFGTDHITVAETLNNLGIVYVAQRRYKDALVAYNEAKRIMIMILGPEHNLVAYTLNNLGIVYREQSRYVEAIAAYQDAQRIKISTFGCAHPAVAQTLINLGNVYALQTCYEKAIAVYSDVLQLLGIPDCDFISLMVSETQISMAHVLVEQKKFNEARALYQKAQSISTTKTSLKLSFIREGNTYMLLDNKDIENASRSYQHAKDYLISQNPEDPKMHQALANQFYSIGHLTAALEQYRILIKLVPENTIAHLKLASLLHTRACIDQSRGEVNQALQYIKEANSYFESALQLDTNPEVCTLYAQFLWKNHDYSNKNKVVKLLQSAINSQKMSLSLSYAKIERPTLDQYLQGLFDEENKLTIRAIYLAYYLLIQLYCETHQQSLAQKECQNLQVLIKAEINADVSEKAKSLGQVSALISANPLLEQVILAKFQPLLVAKETEQRHNVKLVECAQVTIERCNSSQLTSLVESAGSAISSQHVLKDSPIFAGEPQAKQTKILLEEKETDLSLTRNL